jgi:hypothetical protein
MYMVSKLFSIQFNGYERSFDNLKHNFKFTVFLKIDRILTRSISNIRFCYWGSTEVEIHGLCYDP